MTRHLLVAVRVEDATLLDDAGEPDLTALAELLEHAARRLSAGRTDFELRDGNGDTVGSVELRGDGALPPPEWAERR